MKITVDASDALALAADLTSAAASLASRVLPVLLETSDEMAEAMKADLAASDSFGHAADSVSAEPKGLLGSEVGPTKPAGAIANIAYFGGANGGGGTVRDPLEAAESVDIEGRMSAILDDLL